MPAESKTCKSCNAEFKITPEDFAFYEKLKVPTPTWCPQCRMQRRMTWRNEHALYHRQCGLCKKDIITMYDPKSPYTVYCRDCWYGDTWDPLQYGKDYDWNKDFFSQFYELHKTVPLLLVDQKGTCVNSDFGNYNANAKDCYYCFAVAESENVFYGSSLYGDENCLEVTFSDEEKLCYENMFTAGNYQSSFLLRSRNCIDSHFLINCNNCQNCFMSNNLDYKQFIFRNKQLTKEEYFKSLEAEKLGNYDNLERLKKEFEALKHNALYRFANIVGSQDATGDNISNSTNVRGGFWIKESENVSHSLRVVKNAKDVSDVVGAIQPELSYECVAIGLNAYRALFCLGTDYSKENLYSAVCFNSSNLFGCVGLRNKEYCIFNKQYTKEKYEELVPKIIEQMKKVPYKDKKGREYFYGEYFPSELSPFGYNETVAQDYFPLTSKDAEAKGFKWRQPDKKNYPIQIAHNQIPKDITETPNGIAGKVLGCAHGGTCNDGCATAFKVVDAELRLYKQLNIPVPHLCPNCRYAERFKNQNPLQLWKRKCMCDYKVYKNSSKHTHHESGACPNDFETTFAPGRAEVVYCEECYKSEIA